ncbi:MAG: bifunctional demethylmenaquinone methyltransferase/2-methoxy-6-polyprenyl-1,4-benzoquinol methylase UbiE [Muribaculaceae bacterium]|nr:bifunctional demethylmenaquinone methyltransferase/2-methoxy-6-polyprenyl-1,4-benzoquinol methylase UbiE [Muribaculaceae bacterium]
MIEVEKVIPNSSDNRSKTEQVRDMFDNIASSYDNMNRIMSFGMDVRWRANAIKRLAKHISGARIKRPEVLDLACGTADFSIEIATQIPDAKITGVDLSDEMLAIGRVKIEKEGVANRVNLSKADCLNLPFPDNCFDCVTAAFGVRNFQDLARGYKEMFRVLRRGGVIWILESSVPSSSLVRPFYNFYAEKIIPMVARLLGKNNKAYKYLPASIRKVPSGDDMITLITDAGFINTSLKEYFTGVCTLYMASKP